MTTIRKLFFLLCTGLAVSNCSDASPVDFKPLSFARYQPIYLNVSSIEFVNEYKSPMTSPYAEHLMPYSPEEAMRIWVKERIRAVGPEKLLQVVIKDARVIASELHKPTDFEQFFVIDQDRRYDAVLDVELRVYGYESALSEASINVKGTGTMVISENASLSRRNFMFRQMIGKMMAGINAEMEKNLYMYMANYINYSQNP